MDLENFIGYMATIMTVLYLLPQVVKTWKMKSTGDISLGMYVLGSSGALFWALYGIMIGSIQLVITNIIVLTSSLIILAFKIKYK